MGVMGMTCRGCHGKLDPQKFVVEKGPSNKVVWRHLSHTHVGRGSLLLLAKNGRVLGACHVVRGRECRVEGRK